MRLNLRSLQNVVKETIAIEQAGEALKTEIGRVLGPSVLTTGRLEEVVAQANDRIDVLDRTGRANQATVFQPELVAPFLDHRHPEVRRFAARVIPERFLGKMTADKDSAVRAAVALRVPLQAVKEMMKRFTSDDALRTIYKERKHLTEAGISQPETEPMGHDPVEDAERMGDAAKTALVPELSDGWYEQQAHCFMRDYGHGLEYAWEPLVARRFCSSVKATSGVDVDEDKLVKAIRALAKERDETVMDMEEGRRGRANPLLETLAYLERQSLVEGELPEFIVEVDDVAVYVGSNLSFEQLVEQGLGLFQVKQATLPKAIRKYRLGEGNSRVVQVPAVGTLPHSHGFRALDEQALDAFCEAWTQRQAMAGEPIRLQWAPHAGEQGKVNFTCGLR